MNILRNAMEAIDGSGQITIRLLARDNRAVLEVEDTGSGLSTEAQANLFTPFFSTKPNGQGIGLTLTQEVLTAHDCGFSLERLPSGVTRFTVLF